MRTVFLSDVVDVFDHLRKPLSTMSRSSMQGSIPYYSANGVIDHINQSIFHGQYILVAEDGSVRTSEGHPVVKLTGPNEDFWVSNHAHVLKAKSGISTRYLYYNLCASNIDQCITGAVQLKVSQENLLRLPISLHSAKEQQHIVGVIGSVDDLIEKEGETIKKLDGFAQQFYSSIIENHHEKIYCLADCCDFIPGYSYTGSELQDSEIGMVSIKSFERTGGFKLDGVKPLLPSKSIASKKCDIGDVLVAHTDLTKNQEIIGSPVIVTTKGDFKELTFSMDLVKVVSKVEWLNNAVLYRVLNSSLFKKHALGFCTGTTVLHLSKKALETYKFDGPASIDERLAKRLEDIQKTIAYKTKKIEELESTKSTLLIKYFGSN